MNTVSALTWKEAAKITVVDVLILSGMYALASLSHVLAFPLYYFDPMRLMLFLGFILVSRKANAYILAFTLPLFTYLTVGFPVFPKNILIMVELLINVAILLFLLRRVKSVFAAALISIVASKLVYYALKATLVALACADMQIISTNFLMQIAIICAISGIFAVIYNLKLKKIRKIQ